MTSCWQSNQRTSLRINICHSINRINYRRLIQPLRVQMKPLNPWLVFRSLSIACLVAVALVIIYFVYVARVPALEAFGVTVQLVLTATVLL